MGRQGLGLSHVDALPGTAEDRERLRVILLTLSGALSVSEACARLSLSETRFAALRTAALSGALAALAPRPAGRPRTREEEPDEVATLREQVRDLRLELACAGVKTEIALVMPKPASGLTPMLPPFGLPPSGFPPLPPEALPPVPG